MTEEDVEIYGKELFVTEPEPQLVGVKCKSCGNVIFPPTKICNECLSKELEEYKLSRKGKIHSFSIVRVPPDPSFKVPYAIAWIELPDDVLVFGQLEVEEKDYDKLKIGMEVETVVGVIRYNGDKPVISYKFKPIF